MFTFVDLTEQDVEAIFLGLDELKRKKSNATYVKLVTQIQRQAHENNIKKANSKEKGAKK